MVSIIPVKRGEGREQTSSQNASTLRQCLSIQLHQLRTHHRFVSVTENDPLVATHPSHVRPGAFFAYHPDFTNATMIVTDATHPSTEPLPERWNVTDEIYNYTQDPRQLGAVVVLAADETSYVGAVTFVSRCQNMKSDLEAQT